MVSSQCLAITFLMGYLPVRIARIRILSGLGNDALGYLLKKGDITDAEYRAALEIDHKQSISVHLPYSQTYL